jgi:pilus assembly protein Flp/PilA
MTTLFSATRRFWNDEQGVTAIEYGLIAALIGVAAIVGLTAVGTKLQVLFNAVSLKLVAPT